MKKKFANTREELLTNTINYFNINNRGKDKYNDKINSFSLGRQLKAAEVKIIELKKELPFEFVFEKYYPQRLKNLGYSFLVTIENLHFNNCYWCSIGLSLEGRIEVNRIIEQFRLDLKKQETGIL